MPLGGRIEGESTDVGDATVPNHDRQSLLKSSGSEAFGPESGQYRCAEVTIGCVQGDVTGGTANTSKALGALRGFAAKLEKVGGADLPARRAP